MEKEYTITVFSGNQPGVTHRITSILLKQKVNIYSLSAVASEENNDAYKIVIVIKTTGKVAENITNQINKQIDVFKAFVNASRTAFKQQLVLNN